MDIHIDLETVKFTLALIIAGSLYGYHCYKSGRKSGWDNAVNTFEYLGFVQISDEGEIERMSDKQYREFRAEIGPDE